MEKKKWTATEAKERFMEMAVEAQSGWLKQHVTKALAEDEFPTLAVADGLSVYAYHKTPNGWIRELATFTEPERVEPYLDRLEALSWTLKRQSLRRRSGSMSLFSRRSTRC